jgi:hypothetical protein
MSGRLDMARITKQHPVFYVVSRGRMCPACLQVMTLAPFGNQIDHPLDLPLAVLTGSAIPDPNRIPPRLPLHVGGALRRATIRDTWRGLREADHAITRCRRCRSNVSGLAPHSRQFPAVPRQCRGCAHVSIVSGSPSPAEHRPHIWHVAHEHASPVMPPPGPSEKTPPVTSTRTASFATAPRSTD